MSVFYHKLWDLLKNRGITQKELAERLHISTATLSKLNTNQNVSMDTLYSICYFLGCDYGDIISMRPSRDETNIDMKRLSITSYANEVYRKALEWYMDKNNFNPQAISEKTSLALNTVKDFLRGKDLSSRSIVKLMEFDVEYGRKVDELLFNKSGNKSGIYKTVYCNHSCGRRKECFGLRWEYIAKTNGYIPYCYLGFEITKDEKWDLIAQGGCPHPKNTRELGMAIEKYGAHQRGEVEHVFGNEV